MNVRSEYVLNSSENRRFIRSMTSFEIRKLMAEFVLSRLYLFFEYILTLFVLGSMMTELELKSVDFILPRITGKSPMLSLRSCSMFSDIESSLSWKYILSPFAFSIPILRAAPTFKPAGVSMNLYLSSFRYAPSITFFNESISEWRTSTSKFVYFCFLNDSKAVLTYSSFFSAGVITEIKLFIAVAPFFFFQQLIREREP